MKAPNHTLPRALIALALAAGLAACGGGDDDGGDAAGSGLAGTWTTDISSVIADNPAIFAGIQASCSGPMTLTLGGDGALSQTLDGTCTFPRNITGTITVRSSGSYRADGSLMEVDVTSHTGSYTVGGTTQPISFLSDGAAAYTLSGDLLELRPASGPGTVQRYTRAR